MALLVMLRAGGLCAATGRCGHGSLGKRMGPSKVQSSCVPPTVGPELLMRATSTDAGDLDVLRRALSRGSAEVGEHRPCGACGLRERRFIVRFMRVQLFNGCAVMVGVFSQNTHSQKHFRGGHGGAGTWSDRGRAR